MIRKNNSLKRSNFTKKKLYIFLSYLKIYEKMRFAMTFHSRSVVKNFNSEWLLF